jgi:hypothetical protein
MDYVAALYVGAQGRARRDIGQRRDTLAFLSDVVAVATRDVGYRDYGAHLRDMFRVGTVHIRAPKRLENGASSTPIMSWGLMEYRTERLTAGHDATHLRPVAIDPTRTILPVSINVLYEDFIRACEHFAGLLEAEEAAGGHAVLDRWRSVADVLVTPEPTGLRW